LNNTATENLSNIIAKLNLSDDAARALYEVAVDPHGIERNAAPGLVASILDLSLERSNQSLIELLGKNFLVVKAFDDDERLFANYELLGVNEETRNQLLKSQEIFVNLQEAHSKISIKTLDSFFEENKEPIYLGCEVTSHHTFRMLKSRAEAGRLTIFLIPPKKGVSVNRHIHYDEVLSEWVRFLKEGPAYLKKNVKIRITNRPFPQLYTSGLSSEISRFNLYFLSAKTTRRGSLLEVKEGTSLYQLIFQNYQEALRESCPLWRLWFLEALGFWLVKLSLPITLIVLGIVLSKLNNPIAMAISAIAIGLVVNMIWTKLGAQWWNLPNLFRK
jgi:hypothetical protein